MGRLLIAGIVICFLTANVQATVVLWEDWESGTDGWVDLSGTVVPTLSNEQNTTPGGTYSLKVQGNTIGNSMNALDRNLDAATAVNWYVEWSFFDTGATREYLQIRSYSEGGSSGALQQLISFGVYNARVDLTVYNARVTNGGVGWTNTTIRRVPNVWHTMRVEQDEAGNLKFFIDGQLGLETTTTSIYGITSLRVGSALTNGGAAVYFDDIKVGIVPEPATLALLLCGLPFLRRRSA
ncbi:MAG TPA: hypothetical protein PLV57_02600 [Phycisphaerae bacterium]|nr:hypothetical protein [Phycisphaerae bacterium]HOM52167.1 hypothetical protein [Phycisphaerae bacterium]HPP25382.1 hypothetical protein [Phycisphaerae bacterium]